MAGQDRERTRALDESLHRLGLVAPGVQTCVVVSDEGLPIAAWPQYTMHGSGADHLSAAAVAAVAARLAAMAERSLDRLAQGELGRLLLEGDQGTLFSCQAGDVTLAILVEADANMGHVLFAAQKAAAEIAATLAGD